MVMAVKNSPQKLYANGSIGTVVDSEPLTEYPVVEFRDGRRVTMVPDVWGIARRRAQTSEHFSSAAAAGVGDNSSQKSGNDTGCG
ncbi:hypothetical protein KOY48_01785 [Candidatus Minimicrobia naudis]|uniref:Uncharacterized protein n=1 Tax=Candidatus Minimicrobia naudis TaxID=2841263 RepID=A0A8F1MCU2_9BACT|nr:hypothetical protein KOY48_01785 [Candidatus Minimicrobia naudis]